MDNEEDEKTLTRNANNLKEAYGYKDEATIRYADGDYAYVLFRMITVSLYISM